MANYSIGEAHELGISIDAITKYLSHEWVRPIALSLPWFYTWQFCQSPDHKGQDRCIVVVDDGGYLLGFMGLNNREFYLGDRLLAGCELTTWIISQQARGMGLGKAMLGWLKHSYEMLIGMGISEMALPVYVGLGFKYVRHIPRYFRVFNLEALRPVSEITPLGEKVILSRLTRPPARYTSCPVELSEAAELSGYLHRDFHCFSRAGQYLKWRYGNHPVYRYDAFRIVSQGESAVVVVRTDETERLRVLHVIEVFGQDRAFSAVVDFIETYCRDIAVDLADFYCTSIRIGHLFWYQGWLSSLDDDYVRVPHVFHPVELRVPPTTSLALWSKYEMCSLLDCSRLYVTKGDCDFDRPTISYIHQIGRLL